jgi:hypothetical protein
MRRTLRAGRLGCTRGEFLIERAANQAPLVIETGACFVRTMTGARGSRCGLSAPLREALLMLLANVCVAGVTCTVRVRTTAAATGPEPLSAPPARSGL